MEDDQEGAPSRIQVVVRVRPVLPHERLSDVAVTCVHDGSTVQVLLPEREPAKPPPPGSPPQPCQRADARQYEFDACLAGSTTQARLFELCGAEELVEAALDGCSATVFAFGQTGSGKTHTIVGPRLGRLAAAEGQQAAAAVAAAAGADSSQPQPQPAAGEGGDAGVEEEDGLLPRCVRQLFSAAAARAADADFAVEASCCEVYNESVTDLLAQPAAGTGGGGQQRLLQVRQEPRSGSFYVAGLTQRRVRCAAEALAAMAAALAARRTRAHRLNACSSRSHCLMSFQVTSEDRSGDGAGGRGVRRRGKLVLVDLAGSERLRDTQAGAAGPQPAGGGGERGGGGGGGASRGGGGAAWGASGRDVGREQQRESGSINKSLFTLGQVLAALSAGRGHVPYRDARLTQLLWDGLRGTGRALMVACLAPLRAAAEESINTLHFAGMALRIQGAPVVTVDPQDAAVMELRTTIRALRADIASLASALRAVGEPGADVPAVLSALPPTLVEDALRLSTAAERGGGGDARASASGGAPRRRAATSSGRRSAPGGLLGTTSVSLPRPGLGDSSDAGALPLPGLLRGPSPLLRGSTAGGPGAAAPRRPGRRQPGARPARSAAAAPAAPFAGRRSAPAPQRQQGLDWVGTSPYAYAPPLYKPPPPRPQQQPRTAPWGPSSGGGGSGGGGGGGSGTGYLRSASPDVWPISSYPRLAAAAAVAAARGPGAERGPRAARLGAGLAGAQAARLPALAPSRAAPALAGPAAAAGAPAEPPAAAPAGARDAAAPTGPSSSPSPPPPSPPSSPDPLAVSWARDNPWFGSDEVMTSRAYEAHDDLIFEGIDPSSRGYFDRIEAAVAAAHPERWAEWRGRAGGAGGGAAGGGAAAAAAGAGSAGAARQQAHQEGARPRPLQQGPHIAGGIPGATAPEQRLWPARGAPRRGGSLAPAGAALLASLGCDSCGGGGGGGGCCGGGAAEEAARRYVAARQQVVDELRRAREEAEAQRRAVMLEFGRAVGRRWL